MSNGNHYENEVDYVGTGSNALRFARRYNSFARNNAYQFPFGFFGPQQIGIGWAATYFQRLIVAASTTGGSPAVIYAWRPTGQLLVFTLVGGTLVPDADVADVLTVTPTGFQYMVKDGTIETYDSTGRLLSVAERGQAPVTVTQDSSGFYPIRSGLSGVWRRQGAHF